MSTLNITTLQDRASSDNTPVLDAIHGSSKAWVNFNGTGTVAIRASYNVSSITDNGTGDYTVNFTNAMTDANYSAVSTGRVGALTTMCSNIKNTGTYSTSAVQFISANSGTGALNDADVFNVVVFR